MSKGSWRRPNGPDFDNNYCNNFPQSPGCPEALQKRERAARAAEVLARSPMVSLSLDQLRTLVFETSVAYKDHIGTQESEWARAAALKAGLERLGFTAAAELIGGAA